MKSRSSKRRVHGHMRRRRSPLGGPGTATASYSSTKPLNDLVATAIAAVKRLQQVGVELASSAAPITTVKAETTPSLTRLTASLKELSDLLTLRNQLVTLTLGNISDSVKKSGEGIQGIANDIQKQLETLDVQLSIEKQFSRYLT